MRRLASVLVLAGLSACAQSPAPDLTYPVFFTDFSSTLDPAAQQIVSNAAAVAKQYPRAAVKVTGYADRSGSTDSEVAQSKARADAVAAMLEQDGVAQSRIERAAVGTPPNSQPGVERRRVTIFIDNP